MTFESIGVSRHRIGIDGAGVTTLVCGYGCPLRCRHCLNPQCMAIGEAKRTTTYKVETLYEKLEPDSLYFEATGGGVTFGGGEPLLQAEFIAAFIKYVRERGDDWRFTLESSLAVERSKFERVIDLIDEFIVDIKDTNDHIYRAYTGKGSDPMRANLEILARHCPDKVIVKTPLIPEFNTRQDIEKSHELLKGMGFTRFAVLVYRTDIKKL